METEALQSLMDVLRLDCAALAARLGGRAEHYQRLSRCRRLPFPIWDALQRLAFRKGYAWNAKARRWQKAVVVHEMAQSK